MTLDDAYISQREAMRRQEEVDAARRFADYQEQRLLESEEAELARWRGIFRRADAEREAVHYDDRPAIDRRLFAIDGDLIEQARRDRDVPTLPGHVA